MNDRIPNAATTRRTRGTGSVFLRGSIWWIKHRGPGSRVVCESTRSTRRGVAERLLTRRLGELETGTYVGRDRVRLGELFQAYVEHRRMKRRKSEPALGRLCDRFDVTVKVGDDGVPAYSGGWKVTDLDPAAVERYTRARRADGAADATIHNELAALRAALRLGSKMRRLTVVPHVEMPGVRNVRESYFTVPQFDRLLDLLPDWLRAPARFAVLSGWRAANVFGLTWEHVDFGRGTARAPTGSTKNGDAIAVPFDHGSALEALLREREQVRDGPFVFHRDGRPIVSYAKAWRKAVRALDAAEGFEGAGHGDQFDPATGTVKKVLKRWHDLRYTAAQWLSDAGVPAEVIVQVGGWRTAAMLERYRIVSDAKKRAALKQRDQYEREEREATTPVTPIRKAASA